jgi:hypothetical protein
MNDMNFAMELAAMIDEYRNLFYWLIKKLSRYAIQAPRRRETTAVTHS